MMPGVNLPAEKGGVYRYVDIQEPGRKAFGQSLANLLAAAAMLGHSVVHLATGIGPVQADGPPVCWAQVVIYQPPAAPTDTPVANATAAEPMALNLVKLASEPSA
ncbi:MAG: hypothetical protein WBA46_05790 [Thermomicrobiales bacterium]